MKDKLLVVHFDGKLVKHIEEESRKRVTADRMAVSVTSPEFSSKQDLLLGVVPLESGKSEEMAIILQNLMEYFEISEDIFAFCADTTVSNTGKTTTKNFEK